MRSDPEVMDLQTWTRAVSWMIMVIRLGTLFLPNSYVPVCMLRPGETRRLAGFCPAYGEELTVGLSLLGSTFVSRAWNRSRDQSGRMLRAPDHCFSKAAMSSTNINVHHTILFEASSGADHCTSVCRLIERFLPQILFAQGVRVRNMSRVGRCGRSTTAS